MQHFDSSVIIDALNANDLWCVYEHQVVMTQGEPPTTILIGSCKLIDVYRLTDGKTNTEWARIFTNGGHVMVRIVGITTDKQAAFRSAQDRVRASDPQPICNIHGYNVRGHARAVRCLNNGKRYNTQTEAATDLNINPSQISRHLRGELSHAGGLRFVYDMPGEGM